PPASPHTLVLSSHTSPSLSAPPAHPTPPSLPTRRSSDLAGTLNPVYELLDFPIAMGRADDVVLTGPAPEKPLVDGREVTDPRLIAALSVPVELDRADVLDRSAKLAGVLRTMGVIPESGAVLTLAEDVPPLARALTLLAAARIGLRVDLRAEAGEATETAVVVHGIDAPTIEPGRASVRITRSR